MKFANLHLHSMYSDGVLTPKELCKKAKAMGYGAISLTDHYTDAGTDAIAKAADAVGLSYIRGMECTGLDENGTSFHIVAYDFDPTANGIASYIKRYHENALITMEAKVKKMLGDGVISGIVWQDVLDAFPSDVWLCNEHIFFVLCQKAGYDQTGYWDYIKRFHGAKVDTPKLIKPSAEQMIRDIVDAGGVASLAHPHHQTQYLPKLYAMGLRCVEIDHPDIDAKDASEALAFARNHGMYVSGGTDHTGRLANHSWQRGDQPGRAERVAALGETVPLANNTEVFSGVSEADFLALKNRIYG